MDEGSSGAPYGQDPPPPPPPPGSPPGPPGSPPGPPGGYGAAPPNFGPPPGYGSPPGYAPGYGAPGGYNTGTPNSDERTWAMLSHLSFFVLGIIGPIVVMLTKGKESAFVRDQAVEALNFHITVIIAIFVSIILIFVVIGIFTLIAVYIAGIVLSIIGAMAAYRGERYRYPVALRLVK